ncbi:MAG TPA: helix-turn-helix transcriptional regulator [Pyrinomonadaceae bacterium]|jgi:transcriptional regulator with XRE-family HTH domain
MGRSNRIRPARLGEKLFIIRDLLGLTQEQLISRLNYTASPLYPQNVSGFETGEREPNLLILLAYARLAGICLDILVDDAQELPKKLPSTLHQK